MDDAEQGLIHWIASLSPSSELEQVLAACIAESPGRISRAYRELFSGYTMTMEEIVKPTVILDGNSDYVGSVIVRDISFVSFCAHHFLPFFGKAHVAYVPGAMIVGLGKIPRLVEFRSRRLQIQELLARDLVSDLMSEVGARGAFAQIEARHLCICSRGPSKEQALVTATYGGGTLTHWGSIPKG
jgi:GTP cyclohydrolase I